MARRLEYEITTDPSKGIAGLKQFSSAAKRAMKDVADSEEDATSNGQKLAKVLGNLADDMEKELKQAAAAADALAEALGPEIAARSDIPSIVADLNKLGLEFEEITADADQLAVSIKKLDSVQMSGPAQGLERMSSSARAARTEQEEFNKTADSSKSVLANMVGNTTQDLGQLAGVSGSAGVAIGQMGEYFSDATLAGQGFASAMKDMGKIVGPLAALALGTELVSGAMEGLKRETEETQRKVDEWNEAMLSGEDASDAMAENLENLTLIAGTTAGGFDFLKKVLLDSLTAPAAALAKLVGGPGFGVMADNIDSVRDQMYRASITAAQFFGLIEDEGMGAVEHLREIAAANGASIEDQEAIVTAATQAVNNYNRAHGDAIRDAFLLRKSTDDVTESFEKFNESLTGVEDMPKQWGLVADAMVRMRRGLAPTAEQLVAINELIAKGVPPESIWSTGGEIITQRAEDIADANDKAREASEKYEEELKSQAEQARDFAFALGDAQAALDDMGGGFKEMERNSDAMQRAFDLGNVGIDTLSDITDINEAIRDLGVFIRDEGVPNIFDPNDVDAAPFLDKITSLRDPIQQRVIEAFSAPGGGAEAARATAEAYVTQIYNSLHGKLSKDQIRTLLNLSDITATINIAIDQADLADAQTMLDILTGVSGETPYTAEIKLALAAGDITPQQAKALAAAGLRDLDLEVPNSLADPETADMKAFTEQWLREHPFAATTAMGDPKTSEMEATKRFVTDYYKTHPATLRVIPQLDTSGTGTRPGPGGPINGPRSVQPAGPSLQAEGAPVPPVVIYPTATRSAEATTQINPTINVNVNAAVVGNRYDVMRAVKRANLDKIRLLGTRG